MIRAFFYNLEMFLFHVRILKPGIRPTIPVLDYRRQLAYLYRGWHSVTKSDPNVLLLRLWDMETLGSSATGLEQF
jgi:hypothetical protein